VSVQVKTWLEWETKVRDKLSVPYRHKKVKFFHTRYQALDPELIPVYRQSVRRWFFKVIPGGRLPLLSVGPAVTFPAEERHRHLTGTKLYCLVTEAHRCEKLAQGRYAALPRWKLNPRPIDRKSNALPLPRCATAPPFRHTHLGSTKFDIIVPIDYMALGLL